MATVTKTIGSTSTIDTETPASCSGSDPYDVTFVNDPTGVLVGDKAYITDESSYYDTFVYNVTNISGSTYTLEYVSGGYGAESPCSLYTAWFSQAPAVFKRGYDYESPRDWVADFSNSSVYSSGDDAVGEIQVNEKYDQGISSTTSGAIALNSARLTVHSSVRHDGTAGSGAGFKYTSQSSSGGGASLGQVVSLQSDNFTLEWLEFDGTGAASGAVANAFVTDRGTARDNNTVKNCLMHGLDYKGGGFVSYMIRMTTSTATSDSGHKNYIMNNIVYGNAPSTPSGGDAVGIYAHAGRSVNPIYVYNNTVHDITARTGSHTAYGIKSNAYGVITNNIVTDVTGGSSNDCFVSTGTWHADTDYNLATDTTAPGSNSVNSATLANIYESESGTVDLHLKSGSPAIDAGTDLGTSPSGVNIDIDGRDRDSEGDTWDIGADEYVVNGIEVAPAAASLVAAGVSPTVSTGYPSVSVTPAVASLVAEAVSPTVTLGSLSVTPGAAAVELNGVDPTVSVGYPSISVTPSVAAVIVEATYAGIGFTSVTVTPAAASFVASAVTPTVSADSLALTPSVSTIIVAAISPTVSTGSVSVTPSTADFVAAAVSPSISEGAVTLTPAVGSFIAVGVTPTVVFGSSTVTPTVASVEVEATYAGIGLSSITVDPSSAASVVDGVTPTTQLGSLSLTATASFVLEAQSPSISYSSISVSPVDAGVLVQSRFGGLVAGDVTVIPNPQASIVLAANEPTVAFGSQVVTPSAGSFVSDATLSTVVEGNLTLSPSASIVEITAISPTIDMGLDITPPVAEAIYKVGSFTLIVGKLSAYLGYSLDGLVDYSTDGLVDYEQVNPVDYKTTTSPIDYSTDGLLDYEYDD